MFILKKATFVTSNFKFFKVEDGLHICIEREGNESHSWVQPFHYSRVNENENTEEILSFSYAAYFSDGLPRKTTLTSTTREATSTRQIFSKKKERVLEENRECSKTGRTLITMTSENWNTRSVFRETLRMISIVPNITKFATKKTNLCGYTIPEGTFVNIDVVGLHRNP